MTRTVVKKTTAKQSNSGFSLSSRHELPIIQSSENFLIDARLLHTKLKVRSLFANWIKRRLQEFDFDEGKDFFPILEKSTGGRKLVEYHLTIDVAKELAMLERNEVGKTVRRYFIEAEKELRTKRLYAATSNITEISKTIKPVNINGRKLFEFKKAKEALGYSSNTGTWAMKRAGYGGLLVIFNHKAFVAEEYIKVMISNAKTRALRAEAKAAKPVLPENFGQLTLNMEGAGHE